MISVGRSVKNVVASSRLIIKRIISIFFNTNENEWEDTNDILDEFGEEFHLADELEPGVGYGTPFEDWECRYCSYSDVCPTPIK